MPDGVKVVPEVFSGVIQQPGGLPPTKHNAVINYFTVSAIINALNLCHNTNSVPGACGFEGPNSQRERIASAQAAAENALNAIIKAYPEAWEWRSKQRTEKYNVVVSDNELIKRVKALK